MNWDNNEITRQQLDDYVDMIQSTAAHIEDVEGHQCIDCGGIITTDTTPSYVYKEKDICACNEQRGEATGGGVEGTCPTADGNTDADASCTCNANTVDYIHKSDCDLYPAERRLDEEGFCCEVYKEHGACAHTV